MKKLLFFLHGLVIKSNSRLIKACNHEAFGDKTDGYDGEDKIHYGVEEAKHIKEQESAYKNIG
jgi:hypothetical protein